MNKSIFFNRELSWLEFNSRVLKESLKEDIPLLERFNFLSITESNLDEFFQVRVASIKRLLNNQNNIKSIDSIPPGTLLKKISDKSQDLISLQHKTLKHDILPKLKENGISYIASKDFSPEQKSFTESYFKHEVFPLLTPLRTDNQNLPHIASLKLTVAFYLTKRDGFHEKENPLVTKQKEDIFALVQIPENINRVIWLPGSKNTKQFTTLEDIISLYGTELFPGYKVTETLLFKITRDADFAVDEQEISNFIQAMEEVLEKRQSSFVVSMICSNTSEKLLKLLKEKLNLEQDDIYIVDSLINLNSIFQFLKSDENSNLFYPTWKNFDSVDFPKEEKFWNSIRQKDIMVHVPYESYDPILKFIKDAASDKQVLAIKITLYRTGNDSPIIQALKEATQNGKQVTVFVELKARFDEKRNISWVSELEKAGAIVIYGIVNLKVHAKLCLIIRKENDRIRRYLHISTGNYNPNTAKLYQDISIFTSKDELTRDATLFFNVISGYSAVQSMKNIFMAPICLKNKLIELIDREIQKSSPEKPGHIIAKMNSLCHPEIIKKLYEASQANVKIDLNVRGICTLIPNVKNRSENIKVVSVIDRYLEHSRILYFQNGGEQEIYISSADWMERNLDKRIEIMIPILDTQIFKSLKEILELYFQDNTHSHILQKDGSWKANKPNKKEQPTRVQEILYKKYKKKSDKKKSINQTEFLIRRNQIK